jgi:hypothetical protein
MTERQSLFEDLWKHIFTFLSQKNLLLISQVCRSWRSWSHQAIFALHIPQIDSLDLNLLHEKEELLPEYNNCKIHQNNYEELCKYCTQKQILGLETEERFDIWKSDKGTLSQSRSLLSEKKKQDTYVKHQTKIAKRASDMAESLRSFVNIQQFRLRSEPIGPTHAFFFHVSDISQLTNIRCLILQKCDITDEKLETLCQKNPLLEHIDVAFSPNLTAQISTYFTHLVNLLSLRTTHDLDLVALNSLKTLKSISVGNICCSILPVIPQLRSLEEVEIHGDFHDIDIHTGKLEQLPNLRKLRLNKMVITPKLIECFRCLHKLETISLFNSAFSSRSDPTIAQFQQFCSNETTVNEIEITNCFAYRQVNQMMRNAAISRVRVRTKESEFKRSVVCLHCSKNQE